MISNRKRKRALRLRRVLIQHAGRRGLAGVLGRAYVRRIVKQLVACLPERLRARSDITKIVWGGEARLALLVRDSDVDLAARTNLNLVLDLCGDAGIVPFLIRTRSHHYFRIGMPEDDRARFLDALRSRASSEPLYVRAWHENRRSDLHLVCDVHGALDAATLLAINQFYVVSGSRLRLGDSYACQVEFWRQEDDRLIARHPNRVAKEIPADTPASEVRMSDRVVPSLAPFTAPQYEDVSFPIDAVYTWVDGNDPAWLTRRATMVGKLVTDGTFDHPARYRNREELRFSLRSLVKYAPWVRHIYLVTDGQRPDWLRATHPRLTIVDHRELFPEEILPIYNSHAIETGLHRIKGISNHFLYMNDDVMLGRPVRPDFFFWSNGLSKFFLSRSTIPLVDTLDDALDSALFASRRHSQQVLCSLTGRSANQLMKHAPIAFRRDVLEELESRIPCEFARTASHRLRAPDDVILVWLHHFYSYFTGRATPGDIEYDYFDPSRRRDRTKMKYLIRHRVLDAFCVNDVASSTDSRTDTPNAHGIFHAVPPQRVGVRSTVSYSGQF